MQADFYTFSSSKRRTHIQAKLSVESHFHHSEVLEFLVQPSSRTNLSNHVVNKINPTLYRYILRIFPIYFLAKKYFNLIFSEVTDFEK